MFVIHLMGGLGNQMFQYAAARALSVKSGMPFVIDFDDPYIYAKRKLSLDVFKLNYQKASFRQLLKSKPKTKVMRRLYKWTSNNPDKWLYKEVKDFHYQPDLFNCADSSYVSGFWQTEQYFVDIEDVIRSDFEFNSPTNASNKKWIEQIAGCNAVSVHVRRGDYISVKRTNQIHGTCSLEYYQRAIAHIVQKVNNPVFYCFSDDIEWAKKNLKTGFDTYFIDNNTDPENGHEDMRLMSKCCHHIIANSSFSWWGAWLNPNRDKIVIAPQKWLNDSNIVTKDLIPHSWIKL